MLRDSLAVFASPWASTDTKVVRCEFGDVPYIITVAGAMIRDTLAHKKEEVEFIWVRRVSHVGRRAARITVSICSCNNSTTGLLGDGLQKMTTNGADACNPSVCKYHYWVSPHS